MENINSTLKEPSLTERELDITVPRAAFKKIYNEKVKKYSKELTLNGYRKGSIPKRVIEERFREPLTQESLEKLVDEAVQSACEKHKISPIAPGKVNELKNEGDNDIELNVIVEVDQEVEFTNYQSLNIKQEKAKSITAKVVDEELSNYAKNFATEEEIKGKGKKGDLLEGKYLSIEMDGKETPLGEDSSFKVEVGTDKIKEFNDAFSNCKAGDEKIIDLTYPKDYEVKELAGKHGKYTIEVHKVSKRVLPELNDEFAKKLGVESFKELKESIKKNLTEAETQRVKSAAQQEAIEKIIEATPFDIPKARIEQFIDYQNKNNQSQQQAPLNIEDPEVQKEAAFQLKRYRIIEEVSRKEKIKATQDEVDERIKQMATQYGMEFETIKDSLRKSGKINDIRQELKTAKTLDFFLK